MAFTWFKNLLKPRFTGTPEMFLAMMVEMETEGRKNDPTSASAEQLAGVFMKIFKVNLAPYQDFTELQLKSAPDFSILEKIRPKLQEHRERVELKQAIYGKGVDLGDDNPLAGDTESAKFTRNITAELQKHLKLKDDDE